MPAWEIRGHGYVDHYGYPVRIKSKKAFIWPRDKPNMGRARRALDILCGKGPDIYVATNPNRSPGAIDGPTRRRWTGWQAAESNPVMRHFDWNSWISPPFGSFGWGLRPQSHKYDFKRRRYTRHYEGAVTDIRHDPLTGAAVATEHWPCFNSWVPSHELGDLAYFDPRNFNAGGYCGGPDGEGGYFHPAVDGWWT